MAVDVSPCLPVVSEASGELRNVIEVSQPVPVKDRNVADGFELEHGAHPARVILL